MKSNPKVAALVQELIHALLLSMWSLDLSGNCSSTSMAVELMFRNFINPAMCTFVVNHQNI